LSNVLPNSTVFALCAYNGWTTPGYINPTPEPLMVALQADYSALLFMAPELGQPTQILRGSVSGGTPPYAVSMRGQSPSSRWQTYSQLKMISMGRMFVRSIYDR
jgi:hypothetical protein